MNYRPSTQFDYPVHRHHGFLHRLRRSFWRTLNNAGRSAMLIGCATVAGVALMHALFWYGGLLDESLNRGIDRVYEEHGIEATRDERERAKVEEIMDRKRQQQQERNANP